MDQMLELAEPPARSGYDIVVADTKRYWEGGVGTGLGGVLYLVNLMCRLDLPGCFEDTWRLGSTVGAWGVLELLGRGLLTVESQHQTSGWCSDSLWEALAHLEGRLPDELPGKTCPGNDEFRLPPNWLAQLDDEDSAAYCWAEQRGYLRLWSGTGYLLVEARRNAAPPQAQAEEELRRYVQGPALQVPVHAPFDRTPVSSLAGPLVTGLHPPLVRWLALVLPFLRLWLRQRLGAPSAVEDLCQALLLRPGKLYVTSTHVDLVMRLEDISVPVRRAGLDRDPGWLGDWGRVILFHFE